MIGHYIDVISIILRCIALFNFLFFMIPLQIHEAKVQNGLRKLRVQLLIIGIILTLINSLSIVFLFYDIFNLSVITSTGYALRLSNAIAIFILSYCLYIIYHQQYTDEHKEMIARVHKLTQKKKRSTI